MSILDQIEALERFAGSAGWREMADSLAHRRGLLADQIVHESPERDRDLIAAQIREIDAALSWPSSRIKALTDQRERAELEGADG